MIHPHPAAHKLLFLRSLRNSSHIHRRPSTSRPATDGSVLGLCALACGAVGTQRLTAACVSEQVAAQYKPLQLQSCAVPHSCPIASKRFRRWLHDNDELHSVPPDLAVYERHAMLPALSHKLHLVLLPLQPTRPSRRVDLGCSVPKSIHASYFRTADVGGRSWMRALEPRDLLLGTSNRNRYCSGR
jgi:hypothetical protein